MNRRRALTILIAAGVAAPLGVAAQSREKSYRIGVLLGTSRTRPDIERVLAPFHEALRALGYEAGRNLAIEWREAHGRLEPLPALAAELVAQNVELIVAGTTQAAVAAAKATHSIPIVFVAVGDPISLGLVKTLARPGGNVTGFSALGPATTAKGIELLREVVPSLRRMGVLHTPGDASSITQVASVRHASAALGLQIELYAVTSETGLQDAFRAIERAKPDGLHVGLTAETYRHRKRIADFAAARRIPSVYGWVEYVEAGGLMSYGFSYSDNWRRTADYVDRILKGTKPADLPVQQPTRFELVVNLKAAREIGVTIPQSVLLRADRVIE